MKKDVFDCVKFWQLWYENQTEEEQKKLWLPSKRPTQVADEFLDYMKIVWIVENPTVLEIGVKDGHQRRFYAELLQASHYEGVDIQLGTPCTITGNSQDLNIIDDLKFCEPDGWDIIFIDGNHSRVGAKADWDVYHRMVKPGGFIALHDTHHDHAEYCDGAAILWPEIQKEYDETWDIYYETDYMPYQSGSGGKVRKQCGIGLVRMPE